MVDFKTLTIVEAVEHLKNGDITAVKLAESFLDVIDQRDGEINAFLEVYDDVHKQAEAADHLLRSGEAKALTGIPIALKDNILFEGHHVSAASKILENYTATYDATVTAKLREEGAVLLGRTNMDEFAMGSSTENSSFGVTRNPHALDYVAGGSSGGSAAALAAGMALGTFGSDTGGSVRQPASLCGVVGLKPTYGSVSRHGLMALASSLDVIGPFARTVSDAELLFNVTRGKDPLDSTTVDAADYEKVSSEVTKIGVPRKFLESNNLDSDVYANFNESIDRLQSLGYTIVDIELPNLTYGVPTYYIILPAEASSNLTRFDGMRFGLRENGEDLLGDYMKTRGVGFGAEPRRRIILGTYVLSAGYYDAYYNRALAVRRMIRDDHTKAFEKVDVIATPTTAGPAFKIGEKVNDPVQMYLEDIFTVSANLTGMPAMSIPSGTINVEGDTLPLGLQLSAPHMHEGRLFSVGKRYNEE